MSKSQINESYTWHYESVKIKDMIPHLKNPRRMDKNIADRLQNNMNKYGLLDKPILNSDYSIIGGHQRIKILKKLKQDEVECLVSDKFLSQNEVDELCITLNLHKGEFDFDALANLWEPIDLLQYGFTADQLLGKIENEENQDSDKKEKKKKLKMCPSCGHEF